MKKKMAMIPIASHTQITKIERETDRQTKIERETDRQKQKRKQEKRNIRHETHKHTLTHIHTHTHTHTHTQTHKHTSFTHFKAAAADRNPFAVTGIWIIVVFERTYFSVEAASSS